MSYLKDIFYSLIKDDIGVLELYENLGIDGIWVYDLQKHTVWANNRFKQNFNQTELVDSALKSFCTTKKIKSIIDLAFEKPLKELYQKEVTYKVNNISIRFNASFYKLENKAKDTFLLVANKKYIDKDTFVRIEQSLRETQKLAKIGNWQHEIATNEIIWSNEVFKIFGVSPKTFKPNINNYFDFIHPDDIESVRTTYWESLANKSNYLHIHRVITKDGETKFIEERCEHQKDTNGNVVRSVGTVQDITDKILIQNKLKDSNKIFRHSFDLLCICGFDGYFKTLNPAWEDTLGWTTHELSSKPWILFVHPGDKEKSLVVEKDLKGDETVSQFENRFLCKDGNYKWLSWNSFCYPEEHIIIAIARDVTQQKQTNENIRLNEIRYRGLLNTLEAGVVVHEVDNSVIMYNKRALKLLRLDSEQILGKKATDSHWNFTYENGEKLPVNEYPVNVIISTSKPIIERIYGITHTEESKITWVSVNGFPVFDDNGKLQEVVISFFDITDQKRTRQVIIESEAQFKNLFELAGDAMLIASVEDGKLRMVNQAAEKLLKYSADELIGKHQSSIYPDDDIETSKKLFADTITYLNKNSKTSPVDYRIVNSRGEVVSVEIVATKVLYNGENCIMGIFRDIEEREKTQKELKESEERFRQIAETNQSVIWELEVDGTFRFVSPIAKKIWGYKPNELVGKLNYFDLHPEEGRDEFRNKTYELASQGEIFRDFINPIQKPDGSIIWVSSSGAPIFNSSGKMIGYRGSDEDVTEKLQLELQLKKTSETMKKLAQQVPGVVYQFQMFPDGRWCFPYSSSGMKDIYGFEPEEVKEDSSPIIDILHPEDRDRVINDIFESAKHLSLYKCEFRVILPDKGVQWRLSNARPEKLEDGSTLWHGIITDITDQKRAEEALKISEEKFRLVVNNLTDIVVLVEADTRQQYVSPVSEIITGYSAAELQGLTIDKLLHPDDWVQTTNVWEQVLQHPEKPHRSKFRHKHKTKGWVWLEGSAQNLLSNPSINAVLLTVRDITEQKHYEEELLKLNQAVEQSPVSIAITDLEGNIEYINPKFEQLTGYTIDEVQQLSSQDLKTSEHHGNFYQILKSTISKGEIWTGQLNNVKKSGEPYWASVSISPIKNEKGDTTYFLAVKEDITHQKDFESKLIESERRFRNIFESIPLISVQGYNEKREVIYWNKASELMYGYNRSEAIGKKIEDLIIPDIMHQQVVLDIQNWVDKNISIPSAELVLKRKDGSLVQVYSNHIMIDNTKGEKELFCIDINLNDVKEKEELLRQSEERYRSIIAVSNTGAWEFNFENRELWCSPEYFSMLGYDISDFDIDGKIGYQVWESLLHPDDKEMAIKKAEEYFNSDMKGSYESYFRLIHKNGFSVWIRSRGRNIKNPDGSPSSVVLGTHIDITESKLAEQELREKAKELKLAEGIATHKSELLSAVAQSIILLTHTSDWFKVLNTCLPILGNAMHVDRTYIFENSRDGSFSSQIVEWSKDQKFQELYNPNLQNIPIDKFPLLRNTLKKGESFEAIVSKLKPSPTRSLLESQNIKTIFVFPIYINDYFYGLIGFDDCYNEREITLDEKNIMKSFADSIGKTIQLQQQKEELQSSETKLRSILDSTSDSNILLSPDLKILNFNTTAEQSIEYTFGKKPRINDDFKEYILPDLKEFSHKHLEIVLAGKMSSDERKVGLGENSDWYNFQFYPVFDKKDNVVAITLNITDITKRKFAEERLKHAYSQTKILQDALDNVPVAVYMKDLNSNYIYANNVCLNLFYQTKEELSGKNDFDFFDNKTASELKNIDKKVFKGSISQREISIVDKEESKKFYLEIKSPIYGDDENKIVGLLGMSTDITEAKLSEQKIRESEEYQRSLLRTIPDMLFVIHEDGTYLDVSADADNLLLEPEHFLGKKIIDVMPKSIGEILTYSIDEAIKKQELVERSYDLTINGQVRHYRARVIAFGKDKAIVLASDITAATENLKRITTLLRVEEEQNKRMRNFTHIVSHNLRSHTANMQGLLALLEIEEPEIVENSYVQMIKESSENLNETINHLNEVLDINLSDQKAKIDVDVKKILDRALANISHIAKKSGVNIVNKIKDGVYVNAIPAYVESIVFNMLTNALKFRSHDRKSYIRITSEKNDNFMVLKFEDNGLGMDLKRYGSKVFGMYKTFHGFKDSKGLGLFISKNQAIAMGGDIEVESEVDKGTTFSIYLPYEKN